MRNDLSDKVGNYIEEVFAPEDALLQEMRAKGELLFPGMQISAAEGKWLAVLVSMISAKRVLEIGTFVGTSALWMARAMPDDGEVVTLERSDQNAAIAEAFFARSGREEAMIRVVRGEALESLVALAEESKKKPFDLVFIDASKRDYVRYLELVEPMLRQGGVVVGDNTLLFGAMVEEEELRLNNRVSHEAKAVMTAFNQRLADSALYHGVMLPTAEGMTIAVKNF